jgi:hypothetical protein
MPDIDLEFLRRRIDQLQDTMNLETSKGLASGGSAPHDPGMEARVAKVESDVGHIQSDVSEIKTDLRELRKAFEIDFRLLFGALITVAVTLAGIMAKGFHWF